MNAPDTSAERGKRTNKNIRIDMTPMVDLGFLLITFFIFTSTLSETNAMNLYMPADGGISNVSEENVLSVIVRSDKAVAYEGKWEDAKRLGGVRTVSYGQHGIGKLIYGKILRMKAKDPRDKLMVLIKPLPEANYKNIVDMLDEMLIQGVPSYAIVEPTEGEVKQYGSGK